MPPTEPVEVFISYAQEDESLCEELEKHLKMLQRQNAIASWHNRKIVAGMELKDEIDQHLNRASIILLLLSPDFIASDYHWTVEVTRALERNASGKARVIPVLLRHVDWDTPPINEFSPLPRNRQPVKSSHWSDRDAAFLEIAKGIREEVTRLTANPSYIVEEQAAQEAEKREKQVTILINKADKLCKQGKLEEAVVSYREALQYNPNNVLVYSKLGLVLKAQRKMNEAITAYRQVIKLDPNSAYGYNNLAGVLLSRGVNQEQWGEVISLFRKAIELDPNSAIAHSNLGSALYNSRAMYALFNRNPRMLDEAIAILRKAIELDSNSASTHFILGETLKAQRKLDEAITAYRKAIQLDPNDALYHNSLGETLKAQGKLDEAITAYRKAIQLDPNDTLYHRPHKNLEAALKEQEQQKKFFGLF